MEGIVKTVMLYTCTCSKKVITTNKYCDYFLIKIYVVEAVLLSTNIITFYGELTKIIKYAPYLHLIISYVKT